MCIVGRRRWNDVRRHARAILVVIIIVVVVAAVHRRATVVAYTGLGVAVVVPPAALTDGWRRRYNSGLNPRLPHIHGRNIGKTVPCALESMIARLNAVELSCRV